MLKTEKLPALPARLGRALILCVALAAAAGPAYAGPCTQELTQFEATVGRAAALPQAGPTAPESIGAMLGHQPTPESVRRAQARAQADFSALVERAKILDAAGDRAGCMQALTQARLKFELP
jgi:hypothetical protein